MLRSGVALSTRGPELPPFRNSGRGVETQAGLWLFAALAGVASCRKDGRILVSKCSMFAVGR
jgi:hypothetical protein